MPSRPLNEYPMRTLNRPAPCVEVQRADDGIVYLTCGLPYEPGLPSLIDYLARAAEMRPTTTFLAERDASKQWRRLTYAAASRDTAAVATWLIREGLGPHGAPVMILSENTIEHALLMLGAMRAGVAVSRCRPPIPSVLILAGWDTHWSWPRRRWCMPAMPCATPGRSSMSKLEVDERSPGTGSSNSYATSTSLRWRRAAR